MKPLDRDTGEATKEATVADSSSNSAPGSNIKTNVEPIEEDDKQHQRKGIVNKLKSLFKF